MDPAHRYLHHRSANDMARMVCMARGLWCLGSSRGIFRFNDNYVQLAELPASDEVVSAVDGAWGSNSLRKSFS